ncbi:MAG TPA: helix-turn-helix domain-containing protein [Allocoleopsis sp.]
MKLRYQFRIYPTNQQKNLLAQLFGCCRAVFNDAARSLSRGIQKRG